MFSCLPSIFMYFNQLQPTLPILRVSRCTQCSLLPVYAITRGWSYLLTCVCFPPPSPGLHLLHFQPNFKKKYGGCHTTIHLVRIRKDADVHLKWTQTPVCTTREAGAPAHPHNHHFQLSSARQLPSSTQTSGVAFPKQLGGAPEPKLRILDFILADKLKMKNMHKVLNFIKRTSPSQYAVNCPWPRTASRKRFTSCIHILCVLNEMPDPRITSLSSRKPWTTALTLKFCIYTRKN